MNKILIQVDYRETNNNKIHMHFKIPKEETTIKII